MKFDNRQATNVTQFTLLSRLGGIFVTSAIAVAMCGAVLLGGAGAASAQEDETKTLVLFGDSLMAGYGLDQDDGFAPQLEAALQDAGHDVKVINSSVSGDTTAAGLARLDWALVEKPDAVLLELGANDALRGIEPSQTRDNLAQIIEKLRAQDIDVLLAGMMAPPNMGKAYGEEFNAIYPDLSGQYQVDLYPFFLDGVAADPSLNQDDGMHPTAEGIAVIVERIMPDVVGLLAETSETLPQAE
ncbi:arylesterase [Thalassospira sp. MA62]|nr:arylesterase [Thalassospira sp. MA62]